MSEWCVFWENVLQIVSTVTCTQRSQPAMLRKHGMFMAAINIISDTFTCFSSTGCKLFIAAVVRNHTKIHEIPLQVSSHYLINALRIQLMSINDEAVSPTRFWAAILIHVYVQIQSFVDWKSGWSCVDMASWLQNTAKCDNTLCCSDLQMTTHLHYHFRGCVCAASVY